MAPRLRFESHRDRHGEEGWQQRRQRGRYSVDVSVSPPESFSPSPEPERERQQAPETEVRVAQHQLGDTADADADKENRDTRHPRHQKQRRRQRLRQGRSQTTHQRVLSEGTNTEVYNPDQDPEERRKVRQEYRHLVSDMHEARAEYLQPTSHQLDNAVDKANKLFTNVKQTLDATVDSRFLVSAADLSLRRITQAVLGDAAVSIDLDEFVSKCITFMRNAPSPLDSEIHRSTQGRRRSNANGSAARRAANGDANNDVDDDDDDDDEPLNWEYLGRHACFPTNTRPPVTGFLLGPLSVRKRTRMFTQRRARERIDSTQAVRPQELKQADLEKQETSNLTVMCAQIREVLVERQAEAEKAAPGVIEALRARSEAGAVSDEDTLAALYGIGISDDGGVPLYKFCVNPWSFGQTVENLFYVSFLIRDGTVGISMDSNDLPTLIAATPQSAGEARRRGVQRHQAICEIDFQTWKRMIQVFDIKEPMIPHRQEDEEAAAQAAGAATWYG
ncbi:nuclear protein [Ascosphaera acerosa]|nr:nuclear protein [Ascosphaera acerosa]